MPEATPQRQPASRPRTRRGQDTRAAILRAAERVIGDSGFAAASIADSTHNCAGSFVV